MGRSSHRGKIKIIMVQLQLKKNEFLRYTTPLKCKRVVALSASRFNLFQLEWTPQAIDGFSCGIVDRENYDLTKQIFPDLWKLKPAPAFQGKTHEDTALFICCCCWSCTPIYILLWWFRRQGDGREPSKGRNTRDRNRGWHFDKEICTCYRDYTYAMW